MIMYKDEICEFFDRLAVVYKHDKYQNSITIKAGKSEQQDGYMNFYLSVDFDENDKFIKIGIWE